MGTEPAARLYPQLMRLTARGDAVALEELITRARHEGNLDDKVLTIGLQNAAKKGHAAAARVLLENGARTDTTGEKGSPALYWAVSQPQTKGVGEEDDSHTEVTRLLLRGNYAGCPAETEWQDENGQTIFMSAALRGHNEVLQLLLDCGAKINARDHLGRNILHNLAADKTKHCRWNSITVAIILQKPIDLDSRDDRTRTALHWAAATGKIELVAELLKSPRAAKLNVTTSRGKTPLHLACDAVPAVPAIVELLLRNGADPTATSDGGWTCLHNSASVQGSSDVINLLLKYSPSLLNAQTSTGMTALHFAAQAGAEGAVACLISYQEIKINCKDGFHCTPLIRAAQEGHTTVVNLLAPFNNVNRVSRYALDACNGFDATIVDFRGRGDHQNLVQKRTIYEVLYGKDNDGDHYVTTLVAKANMKSHRKGSERSDSHPLFRWIHLPANNMAWVEALIAKFFIEGGFSDIEGFKAMEKCFSQQHRGPKFHSHFMRPMCQRSARTIRHVEPLQVYSPLEAALKASASRVKSANHDLASSPERLSRRHLHRADLTSRRRRGHGHGKANAIQSDASNGVDCELIQRVGNFSDDLRTAHPEYALEHHLSEQVVVAGATDNVASPERIADRVTKPLRTTQGFNVHVGVTDFVPDRQTDPDMKRPRSRQPSLPVSNASSKSDVGRYGATPSSSSDTAFFMPYLHFETDEGRRKMRQAILEAQSGQVTKTMWRAPSHDETLVLAHLQSSTGLHVRRTLDQFYLHGVDTEDRDADQVVSRYCRGRGKEEKLFMVDQLWMWMLGPGLIITSFPQRWQQPKNDPLNVLDGIIEDLNSNTRSPVQSVHDLALLITARCSGAFDRHRPADEDFQFLDMFESSIGNVHDQETALYKSFYEASATVHAQLSGNTSPINARYYRTVDQFLDIGKETALLQEIKDIRDELNMISMVLNQQRSTLPSLCEAICDDLTGRQNHPKSRDAKRRVEEQKKIIEVHLSELDRMSRLAAGIEQSLVNLLDLKQKQSNAFEARFARDQAAGTVRQGQILLVFTMCTIIFLPMSFMAAFFAIDIAEFPHNADGSQGLPLGYVTKYMFGIGLGTSFLLIAVAFSLKPLAALAGALTRRQRQSMTDGRQSSMLNVADFYKLGRSAQEMRKSYESAEVVEQSLRQNRVDTGLSSVSRRSPYNQDIERG